MELICITCPKGCTLHIDVQEGKILSVTGNSCPRGKVYAENEVLHPVRMLTSTVSIKNGTIARCPVMTSIPIPKEKIFDVMKEIESIELEAPVALRDVLIHDICHTGADLVATRSVQMIEK